MRTADHCDKRRIFRIIKHEGYASPRERYVVILAKFGALLEWYGSSVKEQKTVGGLTGTLDGKGNVSTLNGLRGELPGICIGKEGE